MKLATDDQITINPDKMKTWISEVTGCELTQASQLCTALQDHEGDSKPTSPGKCMGKVCDVGGKKRQVYHVSKGVMGKNKGGTATVFFVEYPTGMCHVVALGVHNENSTASYTILYQKLCWTYGTSISL